MAAIAAPAAANVYKLDVLAARIQDDKANTTRFLVVQSAPLDLQTSVDQAIVSYLPRRSDGGLGLGQLLSRLRTLGFNLTGVASTPSGKLSQERLTLFLSGKATTTAQLEQAVAGTIGDAVLIGAFTAPANPAPTAVSPLQELCPGLKPSAPAAERLAELTDCRLDLAYDVARAKYVSGAAIEDLEREKVVVDNGVKALPNVDETLVRRYWAAQIEASKAVQRGLIDGWKAANTAKFADAPDLTLEVRPKLDLLTTAISNTLGEAWAIRDCFKGQPAFPEQSQARHLLGNGYDDARQQALAPLSHLCQR